MRHPLPLPALSSIAACSVLLLGAAACGGDGASSSCDDLGSRCHAVSHDDGLGEQCHDAGHAGDEPACAAIRDQCLAYCAQPLPDASPADAASGALEHQYSIGPSGAKEAIADLAEGTTLTMSFTGTGVVDWNIHTHGAGTVILDQGSDSSATASIAAAAAGAYFLEWSNLGGDEITVDVTITLDGEGSVAF